MEKDKIKVSRLYFTGKRKATCASFLSTGHEFSKSAEIIFDKKIDTFASEEVKVVYYLIGHSLELIFKAFLHHVGYDIKKLKNHNFGHNLQNLNEEVKKRGLNILSSEEQDAINELNKYYYNKEIGYDETNFELKAPWFFFGIEKKLHAEIRSMLKI